MGLLSGIINLGSNLLNAGKNAVGSAIADQWKEYFYCDSISNDVLMVKGQKRVAANSSNKGSDNIISNGSGIVVNEGQCMIIVEQGKIVDVCAEPGMFTYDASTEPSIFAGKLGTSILDTFKTIGKRFTYGGDTAKDQRVYYFNTKEILDNKFGTQTPIMFRVVDSKINLDIDVQIRCSGVYTYKITNPLAFYSHIAGNVTNEYRKDQIASELKFEFVDALQPAFGALSELEIRPSAVTAHTRELKEAVNQELAELWINERGITVNKISLNPISLTEEDQKKITDAQEEARYADMSQAAAGLTAAKIKAMKDAANNSAGAMTGFMGLGFAQQASGDDVEKMFAAANQQKAAQQAKAAEAAPVQPIAAVPADPAKATWVCANCGATASGKFCTECGTKKPEDADGWVCPDCGHMNKGKFCQECGAKKPAGIPQYACDKCGWKPEDPTNPPKFCPECGDPFNEDDIIG